MGFVRAGQIAVGVIGGVLVTYALILTCLTIPWVQRNSLYAHKFHTGRWNNIEKPETFGFAKNQISPFQISTPDGQKLFAWHVLPLGLYSMHEDEILSSTYKIPQDFTESLQFNLLTSDPDSRLIISFHGNAGHLADGKRPDAIARMASTGFKSHVLTVDYRGFGNSSGSPTEEGLIIDGVTLVSWALNVAKVPAHRIIIVGQSLGTAVTSAVIDYFATMDTGSRDGIVRSVQRITSLSEGSTGRDHASPMQRDSTIFAGVVLVASFTSLPELLPTYQLGGIVPLLAPLRLLPFAQKALLSSLVDHWRSAARIAEYQQAARGRKTDLTIIHATNDRDITWTHGLDMFEAAVSAMSDQSASSRAIEERRNETLGSISRRKQRQHLIWDEGDGRVVRLEVVNKGGHNKITTHSSPAIAITRILLRHQ